MLVLLPFMCASCGKGKGECDIDLRTTGGAQVALDASSLECTSSFDDASYFLDLFFEAGTSTVQIEIRNIAEEDKGTHDALIIVKDRGRDWRRGDCTVDVTTHELNEHDVHQVKGNTRCPAPLDPWVTNDSTDTLSIVDGSFAFVSFY